jgi:hypothetical protein
LTIASGRKRNATTRSKTRSLSHSHPAAGEGICLTQPIILSPPLRVGLGGEKLDSIPSPRPRSSVVLPHPPPPVFIFLHGHSAPVSPPSRPRRRRSPPSGAPRRRASLLVVVAVAPAARVPVLPRVAASRRVLQGDAGSGGRLSRKDRGHGKAGSSRRHGEPAAYNSGGRGELSRGIGAASVAGQRSRMGEAPDTAAPLLVRVDDVADADAEWSSRPHRIALFVEPSPFASVSSPLPLLPPLSSASADDGADPIMPDWIRSRCSAACTRLPAIRGRWMHDFLNLICRELRVNDDFFLLARSYISGYKNRFQNFIKHLREMGDEVSDPSQFSRPACFQRCCTSEFTPAYYSVQVLVVTTHKGAPEEFHGAKVIGSWR